MMRLEFERDRIIYANINLLERDFYRDAESIGGNAGDALIEQSRYPAAGVHARVAIKSGEILAISMYVGNLESKVDGGVTGVIIRVAVDLSRNSDPDQTYFNILSFHNVKNLSEEALYR